MAQTLVIAGSLIAGIGVLMMFGFSFGNLPGDVIYRRNNFTIYIPITTSVLLSVALSALIIFFRR